MLKTSVSSVARETRLITDFRFFELCVFAQQTFQKTSCSYLHVQRIIWPRTRSKASFFTAIFRLFHEVYLAFFFFGESRKGNINYAKVRTQREQVLSRRPFFFVFFWRGLFKCKSYPLS